MKEAATSGRTPEIRGRWSSALPMQAPNAHTKSNWGWGFYSLLGCSAVGVTSMVLFLVAFVDALTGVLVAWVRMFVVGFFIAFVLLFILAHNLLAPVFAAHADGLSEKSRLLRQTQVVWSTGIVLLFIAFVPCSLTMIMLSYPAGGPEHRPVLAEQKIYRLESGGEFTIVSRARYVAVGIAIHGAISIVGLVVDAVILHKLAFGHLPAWMSTKKRDRSD